MPISKNQPNNIFKKVIKDVVHEELNIELQKFEVKMDDKFSRSEERIEQKALERHHLVMKMLDKVVGMFQKHDDEHTILSADHQKVLELESAVFPQTI